MMHITDESLFLRVLELWHAGTFSTDAIAREVGMEEHRVCAIIDSVERNAPEVRLAPNEGGRP